MKIYILFKMVHALLTVIYFKTQHTLGGINKNEKMMVF